MIDNFDDIDRLESLVPAGGGQPVLVRVRPGVKPSTHDFISTGQLDSKFGLALDDARAAIERLLGSDRLELRGLHMHIGSQIFELGSFRQAVEAIAGLGEFPVYDLGGGLGVAYTAEDEPPGDRGLRRRPRPPPCARSSGPASGWSSSRVARSWPMPA